MPTPSPRRSRAATLWRTLPAAVLAGLLYTAPAQTAPAQTAPAQTAPAGAACPPAGLQLAAATPGETRLLCRAWADARAALAPLGIAPERPVRVELAPRRADGRGLAAAFGSYDTRHGVVRLRPLAAYLAGAEGGFAQPPSAALWASYAVHEFTHALVDPHLAHTPSRLVTHEFVAYATQLATLEPALRARILRHYDARRFTDEQGVNAVTYGFAPHRFGVRAFLTVEAAADPAAYLRTRLRRGFAGLVDTPLGG